jgi:predicted RNA polymerase sigma factor
VAGSEAQRSIETVWRVESARLIAGLARMVRDVGFAEDLAQDALVAAIETWPESGVPDNPGAWLMATAKNRAIDLMRRGANFERKQEELVREVGVRMAMDAARVEHGIGDDLLALIFTCCHPVLGTEARVALTLKLLGGLTTPEIARALDPDETEWVRIAALYDALAQVSPSPVVELNRAVAIGMAFGPEPALALLEEIAAEPALARYHLLPSVRGDLLAKLGRGAEARAEFERAAGMTANERERALLLARAEECG